MESTSPISAPPSFTLARAGRFKMLVNTAVSP
ncbi:Uncharacterised protein [Mycobacteroides abscessus subsp. abscessus]|nr:Uncharacterised protein [Mycobacteroides abscessus subsp. abscessus]